MSRHWAKCGQPRSQATELAAALPRFIWALIGFLALACGPATAPSSPLSPSPGVSIPVEQLPPDIRCLVEHGARIIEVQPPLRPGDPPRYQLSLDLPLDEARMVSEECSKLRSLPPPLSETEIREIYRRWVSEYECLVELGYRPDPPPSMEKFVADWQTGPWHPLQGIDTGDWTDAQYQEAKDRCGLEYFSRD